LDLDNRQIYIRVSFPDSARQDINTISSLRIPTLGGLTSLATIADITNGTGPSEIDRYDRQRYVTVNADLGGEPLGQALAATKALPAIKNLPSPVRLIDSGDAEMMAEIFSGFGLAMLTSVFCVFCVLVLLFNDFFQPITILCALPLSIGGAILALLLTHEQMGIPSLIGMIMLIGIVTKNSILLVEYTVVGMRDRHLSCEAAILDACHKRARPIIMTSIAMIAGMMPIALGLGGDASFRQPMAIAVIGGLITSTALSLLVVPVTYSLVNGFESWCRALFSKHPELIIAPIGEEASRRKMAVSAGK
jgi:multidrug efflux pump subunit AcrB